MDRVLPLGGTQSAVHDCGAVDLDVGVTEVHVAAKEPGIENLTRHRHTPNPVRREMERVQTAAERPFHVGVTDLRKRHRACDKAQREDGEPAHLAIEPDAWPSRHHRAVADQPVRAATAPTHAGRGATARLTLDRNFGPYFWGNILSNCGTWFQYLGQSLLVFRLRHSTFLVGVVNFA